MTSSSKRVPPPTLVSKAAIEKATMSLQDLPERPRERWSLREAISLLRDEITDALNKGYTYEEIAALLNQRGIQIRASSLKYYLSRSRKADPASMEKSMRAPRRLQSRIEDPEEDLSSQIAPLSLSEPDEIEDEDVDMEEEEEEDLTPVEAPIVPKAKSTTRTRTAKTGGTTRTGTTKTRRKRV
jgi:hypothetical protein